ESLEARVEKGRRRDAQRASHAVTGDPAENLVVPVVLLALAAASWALRPPSRTLVPLRSATARGGLASPVFSTRGGVGEAP
ncbi:MAG TPA: hypothetical protein VER33_01145, partial [Polyangiaceae bacterium]|nr:hypothetical protein [Polyangiaceae bacterium]